MHAEIFRNSTWFTLCNTICCFICFVSCLLSYFLAVLLQKASLLSRGFIRNNASNPLWGKVILLSSDLTCGIIMGLLLL